LGISIKSNSTRVKAPVSFYDLQATANNGDIISFEKFRNKNILLVNLASKCGFTPQYNELEKLHQVYKDNLNVLGFPSDDFGGQEPGNDAAIAEFCRVNYGVTFQLFHKDHVKGNEKQPVYQWLCDAAKNGWNNDEPTWNFCKYLIDKEGQLVTFFSSSVSPLGTEVLNSIKL
jgi:glutathione peroxidase